MSVFLTVIKGNRNFDETIIYTFYRPHRIRAFLALVCRDIHVSRPIGAHQLLLIDLFETFPCPQHFSVFDFDHGEHFAPFLWTARLSLVSFIPFP